ncbi:MAG: hypothetical protein COB59_09665 [Rhodospirillaceae bacterium]|nr:MAG: hypothetical protein COB59_09665 [Rhodospirillaceae bacterium]
MIRKISYFLVAIVALFAVQTPAQAAEDGGEMMPFVRGNDGAISVDATSATLAAQLTAVGFEIVGTYAPYTNANILIISNATLQATASKTEFGGYGAAQRVSITEHNGSIQVGYTNPSYMAAAYQMDGDLSGIKSTLKGVLGDQGEYGPPEGLTVKDLNGYHYMIFMPYFDNPNLLGSAPSHKEMVDRVEANLKSNSVGVSKVFRIDIPGKEEVVFGVSLKGNGEDEKEKDDAWVMSEIDFKDVRSTAHLPIELIVSGKKAWALDSKFRIAINFPDLSMTGDNSFMNIMGSPGKIQEAITIISGGNYTGEGKYAN